MVGRALVTLLAVFRYVVLGVPLAAGFGVAAVVGPGLAAGGPWCWGPPSGSSPSCS